MTPNIIEKGAERYIRGNAEPFDEKFIVAFIGHCFIGDLLDTVLHGFLQQDVRIFRF
jgi:hypothetical protein